MRSTFIRLKVVGRDLYFPAWAVVALCLSATMRTSRAQDASLHDATIQRLVIDLESPTTAPDAAENLGMLRAYQAADALAAAAASGSVDTRRAATLSLAWCGGRKHLPVLQGALDDADWSVRQAAWVALTNLTGMEFPFDAHAQPEIRNQQAQRWRDWWVSVPIQGVPPGIIAALGAPPPEDLAAYRAVSASSTYKGPASALTDPADTGFWQTKNVPFPQHCTIDLGRAKRIGRLDISQYGKGFCMTDYAIEVSSDGGTYREVFRDKGPSPPILVIPFQALEARFVRIVSYASENPIYPTTFFQVSIFDEMTDNEEYHTSSFLARERALRALGALGGNNAGNIIVKFMTPYLSRTTEMQEEKLMVQAGIRSLGRSPDRDAQTLLIQLLGHPQWARYAADALGDRGGMASAEALIEAYPSYATSMQRKGPAKLPKDDRPGFEASDRMYETPHAIALSLSRLPLKDEVIRGKLRAIAPLLVVNMAGDFDGAMLYEEQAFQKITRYLLERAGMLEDICDLAFEALGQPEATPRSTALPEPARQQLLAMARTGPGDTSYAARWLTALCRDKEDTPRLIKLLGHENGWVRINIAKTLMFMNATSAVETIATFLKDSKTEAEHGYFAGFLFDQDGTFGQDEYNAPSPCWREAYTRALGQLGSENHVPLLIHLLRDDRNVLEVRYSAANSLDQIGTPGAIAALRTAAAGHSFHSIRLLAREALWRRGLDWDHSLPTIVRPTPPTPSAPARPEALVFIKGSNRMPNNFQIDIWRQAYSTTDSGPTYRLGDNLYLLSPATTNGRVTPLTAFTGGYVADCEVSWGGTHVIFARREENSPWWHIYEIELESGTLTQLTSGPYHDVQPAYLPDGRIVFSSSRIGMRDEYHGYPATGLTVMNADGTGIQCVGFNLGRDNEPAILPDGRVVFGRLELFYSRLKTEITVQSARPDGSMVQTLYGPEKRDLWRRITARSGETWWGEQPPRHRVLRLTQPQPFGRQQIIVATTGGAALLGPGRLTERIIPRWKNMTVTSPFPLDDHTVLCASTVREEDVDLGLYVMDSKSGELTLVYNDPEKADFEARPIMHRPLPRTLPDTVLGNTYTAQLLCNSARTSQETITRERGKLIRIVEGRPITSRHHTHTSKVGEAWKNHTGTHARILGTVPLAADGSFFVEIPADRLIHCQVLDSDRRVVGNQLIWMYARPGETRSCVGCHESPDTAAVTHQSIVPISAQFPPIRCLPSRDDFSYRAKAWQKGALSSETEERTRTVNAVNFPGRL